MRINLCDYLTSNLCYVISYPGLAYDLKTVSAEMIKNRVTRTGDGTHPLAQKEEDISEDHHHPENPVWGWDDQDLPDEDRVLAEISHRKTE